jgi:hypothetical protein
MKTTIVSQEIKINAVLRLDEKEAYVLNHLVSYDYAKKFFAECSHRYTVEEMQKAVQDLREATGLIVSNHEQMVMELKAGKRAYEK